MASEKLCKTCLEKIRVAKNLNSEDEAKKEVLRTLEKNEVNDMNLLDYKTNPKTAYENISIAAKKLKIALRDRNNKKNSKSISKSQSKYYDIIKKDEKRAKLKEEIKELQKELDNKKKELDDLEKFFNAFDSLLNRSDLQNTLES